MTKQTRGPRKMYALKCKHCGRDFTGFRRTAQFCSDSHRATYHNIKKDVNDRQRVRKKFEGKCATCGQVTKRMFVRKPPGKERKVLLCSLHHSEMSREMFRKRVPNPGRGYARRVYLARKAAKEAAELN